MDIYKDRIRPLFDKSGLQDKQIEQILELPRGVIYKWELVSIKATKHIFPKSPLTFTSLPITSWATQMIPGPLEKKNSPPSFQRAGRYIRRNMICSVLRTGLLLTT